MSEGVQPSLRHHCGVFGVSGHPEAARLTVAGLHALQHRGEESAGVVTELGRGRWGHGLVSDVFREAGDADMPGRTALGHVRYATMGGSGVGDEHVQPLVGKGIAVAHNGTLTNVRTLHEQAGYVGDGDTAAILHLYEEGGGVEDCVRALRCVEGAWSIVALVDGHLVAGRDAHGFRPLVLGILDGAFVVASETTALDYVGADYWREVAPGEVVVFREGNLVISSYKMAPAPLNRCVFEHVYFARPDSVLFGSSVHQFREESGVRLAEVMPVGVDVVIAVPDSGVPAAIGYARASGVPYGLGFVRSHYVGRTFISPGGRDAKVRRKLSPVPSVVKGKRLVVVDDSLVRGTTSRALVGMLRQAGATEVHVRIASPPVRGPCYYGIDTPTREELLATGRTEEEMRVFLGCDSLAFLPVEAFPMRDGMCGACFTGKYPVVPA